MTDCASRAESLAGLVFDALDDEAAVELQLHLESCAPCRAEERRLLALRDRLGADEPLAPALRERVRATWSREPRLAPARGWRRPVPVWAALAACAVVALVILALPRGGRLGERLARAPRRPAPATIAESPLPFAAAEAYDTRAWRDSGGVVGASPAGRPGETPNDSL
jgi:hypothetical protein